MRCKMSFRKIALQGCLTAALAFIWSCSEGPAPGPMSPLNSSNKSSAPVKTGTVRPVKRAKANNQFSLAKSGYNQERVLEQLQEVRDELNAIVDKNPRTHVAFKLDDAVTELNRAIFSLFRNTSRFGDDTEDAFVLYKINRAQSIVQEAANRGLLLTAQGKQFMQQLAAIEKQIETGNSPAGDFRGHSKYLWIDRDQGGLIKFAGHGIDVPKYATKQNAEFSISIAPNDYITVDFGPDGYFERYVTVTISYKDADLTGIDLSKLTLAWYDEKAGQWIDIGGVVDPIKKTVTARNNHFTQYTLSTN